MADRYLDLELIKITEHFYLSEFNCHDGTPYPRGWIDSRLKPLCENLEIIRTELGEPMNIISGYRTPQWNSLNGGARNSQHLEGRAADFWCKGKRPATIARIIQKLMEKGKLIQGGIGLYDGFVHYDLRGTRAFWTGSRKRGIVSLKENQDEIRC